MKSLLVLAVICLSSALALTCYTGTDSGKIAYDCNSGNTGNSTYDRCIKYDFVCTDGDTACTSQQIKDKDTLTAYMCGTQALCSQMEAAPSTYKNVLCCDTNECNGSGAASLAVSLVGIALTAMLL